MIPLRQAVWLLAALSVSALSPLEAAVGEKLDPTKRASISTSDSVKPEANPVLQGNTLSAPRVVRMAEIPITTASMSDDRAAIEVRDTREKRIITGDVVRPDVRNVEGRRAADRPALIPALDRKRFDDMLNAYADGKSSADEMLHETIVVGGKVLNLGEINRFANPRHALEAQGIPVIPAAGEEVRESESVPVPYGTEEPEAETR